MKFAAYDDISIYGLDYARTPDIYIFTRSGICARGAVSSPYRLTHNFRRCNRNL